MCQRGHSVWPNVMVEGSRADVRATQHLEIIGTGETG
jgi:hypothetical protein